MKSPGMSSRLAIARQLPRVMTSRTPAIEAATPAHWRRRSRSFEIEARAEGHHHRGGRLQDRRVGRGAERDAEVGAAGGDEEPGEAQEREGAQVGRAQLAELLPAAAEEQHGEERGGERAAQRDQHIGREVGEGELGERGIGAPERGDEGEGEVRPRLTGVGHPPMIARPPWRTTSSSAACGFRVHAPMVFEFFADPRNLERIHPAWARPRWLAPPPPRLSAGAVLDFRAAALPGRWRVIVREFDPPFRFVDAQVVGPFARWEHRHRFTEGRGGRGRDLGGGPGDLPAAPGRRWAASSTRWEPAGRSAGSSTIATAACARSSRPARRRGRAARCRARRGGAARARSGGRSARGCSPSRCACRA